MHLIWQLKPQLTNHNHPREPCHNMIYLCLPPGFNSIWDSSRIHNILLLTVYGWHFFSHFLWWPVSCNSLRQNAWDLSSYISCGISMHYISRTGAWESLSQSTLALNSPRATHTHTRAHTYTLHARTHTHTTTQLEQSLSASCQDSWETYFKSLFIYLHLSFKL